MQIRSSQARRPFTVTVELGNPPTMVKPPGRSGPVVSLDWDRAIDDRNHLRRCPVCGCSKLFVRKEVPQLTNFVFVILAAVVAMVLYGFGLLAWALAVLGVVLAVDVVIFLLRTRVLACYRCHSEYRGLPIRDNHPTWESTVAERFRQAAPAGGRSVAASAQGELERPRDPASMAAAADKNRGVGSGDGS